MEGMPKPVVSAAEQGDTLPNPPAEIEIPESGPASEPVPAEEGSEVPPPSEEVSNVL